jgi:hypothetical protein
MSRRRRHRRHKPAPPPEPAPAGLLVSGWQMVAAVSASGLVMGLSHGKAGAAAVLLGVALLLALSCW